MVQFAELQPRVMQAVESEPDYSPAFEQRMADLRERIERDTGHVVEHESDMNYSAAHTLRVPFDAAGNAVTPGGADSRFELVVFVSSKGPFFTVRGRERMTGSRSAETWRPHPTREMPGAVQSASEVLHSIMSDAGFEPLNGPVLDIIVPGHYTELDGAPATVFQVLFTELF